jgi:HK97 family phage major capsid protein
MNSDIKNAVNELGQAFEVFKEANNQRLTEISRTGAADPLTETKVNRLNAEVSRTQELTDTARKRLDQLETAIKRAPVGTSMNTAVDEAALFSLERKSNAGQEIGFDQYDHYKKSLRNYIRRNNAGADIEETKALSAGSDPDGGYWVTPDISGRITGLVYESSPMRQVANVVTIGTDTLEGISHIGEAGAGWVGETDARPETDSPLIDQWSIGVHELYAEPRATQRLLDDAMFNVDEWLAGKIAERLARLENTAFVTGNGVGKPKGFLTYAAGTPSAANFDVIEQLNSGAAGGFAAADPGDALINMIFSLKASYRDNAAFMMKRSTLAEVRKLKDADGNYLWTPDFQMKQGGTLLGFDIVEAEDMPEIAADSLSIAFGDFKAGYQIVDRQGVRILRDNLTTKPYVKFYTTKRVGGGVVNFDALKLMKFAA